jgi:nitroreductase
MRPTGKGLYVDVGTATQNMLLAAHSLGLGAGVVTSFSQAAVGAVLNLPGHLSPEMLVCLGYPAPVQPPGMRPRGRTTWQSLTDWERFATRQDS